MEWEDLVADNHNDDHPNGHNSNRDRNGGGGNSNSTLNCIGSQLQDTSMSSSGLRHNNNLLNGTHSADSYADRY